MPVVKKNDAILYDPPPAETLMQKSNDLIKQFSKYAQTQGLSPEDVYIQRTILPLVILRVDKREGYFMVFHEQTKINEVKQAALMAYWILKFRPFTVPDTCPSASLKNCRINEGFAAFYIFGALKKYSQLNKVTPRDLSPHLVDELMYAFTYWDLSKEAIILISETLGESFFGIQAQGI